MAAARNGTVGTNPVRRVPTTITTTGPGARKGSVRYAGSATDGYRSAWSRPPHYVTAVTIDVRWSK
jgi:hypothetical protein